MVRSIGADHVIDYAQEDFTKSGQRYDLILDLVANHSFLACRRVLNPKGIYIGAGMVGLRGSMIGLLARTITTLVLPLVSRNFVTFVAKVNKEDLTILGDFMATGRVTPVIDRRYRLSEVPEAIRYLEEKHARGKVVITLEDNNKT